MANRAQVRRLGAGLPLDSGAITDLTDNTAGTADDTLEVLPAVSTGYIAEEKAAIENNLADLAAKVNEILDLLKE